MGPVNACRGMICHKIIGGPVNACRGRLLFYCRCMQRVIIAGRVGYISFREGFYSIAGACMQVQGSHGPARAGRVFYICRVGGNYRLACESNRDQ
jgi:hypothetical protein